MIISESKKTVSGSNDVADIIRSIIKSEHETDQDREHFWAIGLNTKNVTQYVELVSLGNLNSSICCPRETFRLAVMRAAASLILAHNHPSCDTMPSQQDIHLTKRFVQAGHLLGIPILDHIIVGKGNETHFSFRDNQMIAVAGEFM